MKINRNLMVVGILAFVLVFAQVGFIRRGERTVNMTDSLAIDYRERAVNDETRIVRLVSVPPLSISRLTAFRAHLIRSLSRDSALWLHLVYCVIFVNVIVTSDLIVRYSPSPPRSRSDRTYRVLRTPSRASLLLSS